MDREDVSHMEVMDEDEYDFEGNATNDEPKLIQNPPSTHSSPSNENIGKPPEVNSNFSSYCVIGIIICLFAICMYPLLRSNQESCSASFDDIKHQVESLRKKFPSQDLSLWAGIITGLTNLEKKPVEPAVYLLTFDKDSISSSTCIAEVITTLATKLLQPCETRKWLLLNGTALSKSSSKDPGDLIDAINKQNEYSQIVIVPDIQKIPAKLAQGFHSLVDTYGTMAQRPGAVYIFTLMIPRLNESLTVTQMVENILLETWKELDGDELQPLVTRISNFILPVSKEDEAQSCPLKIDSTVDVKIP